MNDRLAAIAVLGTLPWSFVVAGGELTLVFAFGLIDPVPLYVTDVLTYTFVYTRGLPEFLLAWPVGVLLYVLGLWSALSGGLLGREDRRVTALVLVFVGLTQASLAWGLSRRPGTVALPVGTLACWTVVWWFDRDTLRENFYRQPD